MHIWVDADACPNIIKEVLLRAANRTKTFMTLVANHPGRQFNSSFVNYIQVQMGFDIADNYILKQINENDLVITADIPLAAAVIEKSAHALNPSGELYSVSNIKQRLSIRDFSENLRNTGVKTRGPDKMSQKNIQNFSNNLDRILARIIKI